MQTREQVYATSVYQLVSRVSAASSEQKQKYGAMAHKLPVLIRSAGLVQALTFVATREQDQRLILTDLAHVIGFGTQAELLQAARTAGLAEYMLLTEHALAALLWFKRYAQSVLEVDGAEG